MAKEDNLISLADRTTEEQRKIAIAGGKASGEARRLKKSMREMLKECLEMTNNKGMSYELAVTMGLLKGAIKGNSQNYKTIVEMLGELQPQEQTQTPTLNINIVNNEKLEAVMYEEK